MFGTLRRYTKRKTAQKNREAALAAVKDAEDRNDTRDLGRARMQLQEATTALLKASVVGVRRERRA